MILINKVIEHNWVYNMCCYHDLHIFLDFFLISYLVIVNDFFNLLTQIVLDLFS
jgi:hypothetical protein